MNQDVLLFTGQGSSHHFTDVATLEGLILQLEQTKPCSFETFLKDCMRAFHTEYQSLPCEQQCIFGEGENNPLQDFKDPRSLLLPPRSFQSHPVIETATLYLRQILELMVYQALRTDKEGVVETAGLCTGMLPAILASSFTSYTSTDFLEAALQGLRLAFWIGLRAYQHRERITGKGHFDRPWVLGIYGLSQQELDESLRSWTWDTAAPQPHPRISTILHEKKIFLTGNPCALERFKNDVCTPRAQCRSTHVHAFYHGGPDMDEVVREVFMDCQLRSIEFPCWDDLRVSIRCATTCGHLLRPGEDMLLPTVLRAIFVEPCDWHKTRKQLFSSLLGSLNKGGENIHRVIGFGPGSKALVHPSHDLPSHSRLQVIESAPDFLLKVSKLDGVAIVGLSVNYPNGDNKQDFWASLEKGISTISEVPSSRFEVSRYFGKSGKTPRSTKTNRGNFLKDPFGFDAAFFNISPREAMSMDPQQRLLLQAALDALEDAGYAPDSTCSTHRQSFGVYIGAATGDYVDNLRDDIDVYYSPGTLRSFLAGRISYAFDWSGPSMVIDTACSSSAVALCHAYKAIVTGECTAALAGGVNSISSPDMYIGLDRAHFLSPSGQCKPWDADADGYSRSEGCGLVVLKKLRDAVSEGDHIYGIIRGAGVNQCGTSRSITHPDQDTQAALINKVLNTSGISADSTNVVEAHGTGTEAGDACESASLFSVFGQRAAGNPLYLSSIKGNIGHAEAASGVAGLAKILLMLENNRIPPQASFQNLSPRLDAIREGHLTVPTGVTEWKPKPNRVPRRALLNNFGASGSNAAIVLEEYLPASSRPQFNGEISLTKDMSVQRSRHVLNLSAKSVEALQRLCTAYADYINGHSDLRIEDLCYSINARRKAYDGFRSSITAGTTRELLDALQSQPTVSSKPTNNMKRRLTVFAFSGQGGIYRGMGKELLTTATIFRSCIEDIDSALVAQGFPTVRPYLACMETYDKRSADEQIITEQMACFSVEYALARLWMSWGVSPDIVVGHSIGEYAALAIAGVLRLQDAVLLVAERAKLMTANCSPDESAMVTCDVKRDDLIHLLEDPAQGLDSLEIACYNSPENHVVSGPSLAIQQFLDYCEARGIRRKLFPLPYGYHSAAMDPIYDDMSRLGRSTQLSTPRVKVGSSLYGRLLDQGEVISSNYFARHAREPVNFSGILGQIDKQLDNSEAFVIEIGPTESLRHMFRKTMGEASYTYLASLKPREEAWLPLTRSLQTLFMHRYPIRWREVYNGPTPNFLRSLPRYPLKKITYVVNYREPESSSTSGDLPLAYDLLTTISGTGSLGQQGATATACVSVEQIGEYIKSHAVAGVPLCPASVYLEIALEARAVLDETASPGDLQIFEDVTFDKPYLYVEGSEGVAQADLKVAMAGQPGEVLQLSFSSHMDQVHCLGRHLIRPKSRKEPLFAKRKALVDRQRTHFRKESHSGESEVFSHRTIYQVIFPRVVEYSEPFTTLQSLTIAASGLEGLGQFQMPAKHHGQRFVCHPALIDTMLHTAGFLANIRCGSDVACICHSIEQALLPSEMATEMSSQQMEVYCSLVDVGHSFVADAYVVNSHGDLVAFIEGMSFKKISLRSFRAVLSRTAGKPIQDTHPLKSDARYSGSPQPARCQAPDPSVDNQAGVKDALCALVGETCGIKCDTTPNVTLEELGIDSLLFIELAEAITNRFPNADISKSDLERCKTLTELLHLVTRAAGDIYSSCPAYEEPECKDDEAALVDPSTSASLVTTEYDGLSGIADLVQEICGLTALDETNKDQALGELGVDSLLSIELLGELHDRFHLSIENGPEVLSSMTIGSLQECYVQKLKKEDQPAILLTGCAGSETANSPPSSVDSITSTENATPQSSHLGTSRTPSPLEPPVTTTRPASSLTGIPADTLPGGKGNKTALPKIVQKQLTGLSKSQVYLFHDGSGLVHTYMGLSDINRTIFAIQSPPNVPFEPKLGGLEDLAALYIEKHGLATKADVILGGWSFGGVLAFEVARQLHRVKLPVKGLILIDSPPPIDHVPLPEQAISYILDMPLQDPIVKSEAAKKARGQVRARFVAHAAMLQRYSPQAEGQLPCVFIKCTKTMNTKDLCGVEYPWLSDAEYRTGTEKMWQKLVGGSVTVLEVDCNHFEVFEKQYIQNTSDKIRLACEMLETEETV